MAVRRVGWGVVTLLLVSILVFLATQVLPGNAAYAVLQNTATPARVEALSHQLHLDDPLPFQYWRWISHLVVGDPGSSLASGEQVTAIVGPKLGNSVVLVALAGVISSVLGILLGVLAAARRDGWLDHALSIGALVIIALPEFVVGVALVLIFSTVVFHLLPAVSQIAPGESPLAEPQALVLPVATLVLVTLPYLFRMTRAAMIEALESDYVEMAELKGIPSRRVLFVHALWNAFPAAIQVVGLNLLYLAGGIVIVEYVFNYPGIGQAMVSAVASRDVPVIQFIVVILAAFYVAVNTVSDLLALLATPRRRLPKSG
jgi:peptide/nickel transport system permease protein